MVTGREAVKKWGGGGWWGGGGVGGGGGGEEKSGIRVFIGAWYLSTRLAGGWFEKMGTLNTNKDTAPLRTWRLEEQLRSTTAIKLHLI